MNDAETQRPDAVKSDQHHAAALKHSSESKEHLSTDYELRAQAFSSKSLGKPSDSAKFEENTTSTQAEDLIERRPGANSNNEATVQPARVKRLQWSDEQGLPLYKVNL